MDQRKRLARCSIILQSLVGSNGLVGVNGRVGIGVLNTGGVGVFGGLVVGFDPVAELAGA